MANVLAVFAHPDDEVLGAGGTLAKYAENGDDVIVVCLGIRGLDREYNAACETLCGKGAHAFFNLPDQQFDTLPFQEVVAQIEGHALYEPADVIYTHHPGDLNLDHALVARAVVTAFRPKPGTKPRTILACEVLSSTEYTYPLAFAPNYFVALSGDQLQKKVDALACYQSEVREWPHPRSALGIRNLAAVRGQQVGVERAEAFQVLRVGPL